jgi:hypothetical protein
MNEATIKLFCPTCHKTVVVDKLPHDPPQAFEMHLHCEDCIDGGFDNPSYYSAEGRELIEPHYIACPACGYNECVCEELNFKRTG